MDFRDAPFKQCEVAVVASQSGVDSRDVRGEPDAMAVRHELILLALPELNRNADRGEVEAPGGDEGKVVVDPSVHTRTDPGTHVVEQEGGERPSCHLTIGGAQECVPHLDEL